MKYIQLALWAFVVLWQYKTITVINRLSLWRKIQNLFICFLAFCDKERPVRQLHGAMLSALLSALYDYETDWVPVADVKRSLFCRLLEREEVPAQARQLARHLFCIDAKNELSVDGLERGSIALCFYHALIESSWMRRYTEHEISTFGRCLQILDDTLDREEDADTGDKNCLLGNGTKERMHELLEFTRGAFFQTLARRSKIYRKFERAIQRLSGMTVPLAGGELTDLVRPITVVFAFVLTCLGFRLAGGSGGPALLYALIFAGLTGSIMVFNDLCDAERDRLKGKRTVYDNSAQVRAFLHRINMATGALLAFGILLDWKSGLFALVSWAYGLLYSKGALRYPWNNLLVALCSGMPVIVGMIYRGDYVLASWFLFMVVFGMIAIREVFKDIEDAGTDGGYKDTLPVRVGINRAALHGGRLGYPVIVLACCYPNTLIQAIAASLPFIVALLYVLILHHRTTYRWDGKETYRWAQKAIDVFLAVYLMAFWFV